jgi:hypothetical protein
VFYISFILGTWNLQICSAGIGFMIGSFPGVMVGAAAGNRLGAVRDAKGKSVAAAFNDLGEDQKAEVGPIMKEITLAKCTCCRFCVRWRSWF